MAQRDKDKARKLIAKLEAHQAAEIRCLRALHGISSEDIGVDDKDIDIEEDALPVTNRSASPDSSVQSKDPAKSSPNEGPSANSQPFPNQVQSLIPKEWDAEWGNDLLHQRIEERICDPGCGGDQWKSSLFFMLIKRSVTNMRGQAFPMLTHKTLLQDSSIPRCSEISASLLSKEISVLLRNLAQPETFLVMIVVRHLSFLTLTIICSSYEIPDVRAQSNSQAATLSLMEPSDLCSPPYNAP
jgi:hypothetical protein